MKPMRPKNKPKKKEKWVYYYLENGGKKLYYAASNKDMAPGDHRYRLTPHRHLAMIHDKKIDWLHGVHWEQIK